MSSYPPLRVGMLIAGMCLCLYYLMAAVNADYEGAALMLLPGAVTTGFRVWALMPGLDSALLWSLSPSTCCAVPAFMICPSPSAAWCSSAGGSLSSSTAPSSWPGSWTPGWQSGQRADRRDRGPQEHDAQHLPRPAQPSLRRQRRAGNAGIGPEALPALLPALRQRIEFLRRLTEDLFLAAKLEQKQILLNEDHAALNEEAAAVCAACRSEADQKGVELHISADTPLPVWGDSVRLQQIIQNLVTNAIHYTPAGGSIHVDCRAEDETACVSVQDTGCGIAPEDQSAVFDRYFHTTADKKHDSTGLGLTIAQELAHLHHGEITLQSEVGKGSMFTLRLPYLQTERSRPLIRSIAL